MEVSVTDLNFKQEVLESTIPVLVDFWAAWCMPCKMIAPTIEAVAKEYEGKLKVCKLDVEEAPKTASSYGIMSIPTLVIFRGGKVMGQVVGVVSKSELKSKIKPYLE